MLINAATSDEAYAIADKKGEAEVSRPVDSWYTYNGRPAVWVYAGTRKLNECLEYFDPDERVPGGSGEHGTEVTYSSFVLPDEEAMQKLLADRNVTLLYEGWEPEAERFYVVRRHTMKDEYDFSSAKRGAVVLLSPCQTEVRLRLDNEILNWLRERVNESEGGDYLNMVNVILRGHIEMQEDAALIRAIKEGEGSGEVSREEVFADEQVTRNRSDK